VLDGIPFTGARGGAGTLASGPMPGLAAKRAQTLPGLESFASGPALVTRYNVLGGAAASGNEVVEAAHNGDLKAMEIVESAGASMGAVVGSMVNVLDPELVVLGGGLGLADGLYRRTLESAMRRHIWWPEHRDLPLVSAALGADSAIIGAALAPLPPE
jgi:glucokinase